MHHLIKIGDTFNQLVVDSLPFKRLKDGRLIVQCKCVCGNIITTRLRHIIIGKTKSCGCLKQKTAALVGLKNKKHGKAHGSEWKTYYAMLDRCYKPKHKAFAYYGGRGIKVCERWLEGFVNFLSDMGERPKGMTLDRIDSNGNYTPENCKWATPKEQANNRKNNVSVRAFNETLTIAEWSARSGIKPETIRQRLANGLSAEVALTKPITPRNQRHCKTKSS